MSEVPLYAASLDAVQDFFGLGEDIVGVRAAAISEFGNVAASANDPPEHRHTAHNEPVVLDVYGRRDAGNKVAEVWGAAHGLKVLGIGELTRDRDLVYRFATVEQSDASLVTLAVALDVEVSGTQERADAGNGFAVYQYRADDRLFGVVVIRLKTVGNQVLPPGWPTVFNCVSVRKARRRGASNDQP